MAKRVEVEEVNGEIKVIITGEQYDKPPTIVTDSNGKKTKHSTTGKADKAKQQGVFTAAASILAGASRTITVECSGRQFVVELPASGGPGTVTEKTG